MGTTKKLLIKEIADLIPVDRIRPEYITVHGIGLFDTIAEEVIEKLPADLELKIDNGALTLSKREEPPTEGLDTLIAWGKFDFLPEQIPQFKDFLERQVQMSACAFVFK